MCLSDADDCLCQGINYFIKYFQCNKIYFVGILRHSVYVWYFHQPDSDR